MLRGTHSRYKLFANVKELTENTYRHYLLGGGSNNTLPFLLDRLKGTYLRGNYQSDGMERYQWEAGYITKYNRNRHRRYPPKVRAKIFYADL